MFGGTLDSLSCTILLLTTACKICVVRSDEKINPGSCSSFKHFSSSDVLVLSRQHVHHQQRQRFITFRNFYALCQFARWCWWKLTFPTCDSTRFLRIRDGLVPRLVGERLEIIAGRLGVQEVVAAKALVLASRCFYCPG